MIASAAKPKAKKRPRRVIYFRIERLVRPETGESIGAMVPMTKWDARAMRDRKYHVGTELRAELKKPRNVMFHRLSHAMGGLMVESREEFAGLGQHDALKKLQAESGAACETVEYDLPGIGKLVRTEPRSISFDECDEGEFQEIMQTIYKHIRERYFPAMEIEDVEEMVRMFEENH